MKFGSSHAPNKLHSTNTHDLYVVRSRVKQTNQLRKGMRMLRFIITEEGECVVEN